MYKERFTRLQSEIFRLLCAKAGKRLNQREMALLLKVSPTAVAAAIPALEKEELIKVERGENINLNYVELNRDSARAIAFKRAENLKLVYESGLSDFLYESFPGATIILFGSFSRGEDTINSDIDIAIIGVKEKNKNLEAFEKKLERDISMNFYSSFKEIKKHLRNNILNGIVLAGSVDL